MGRSKPNVKLAKSLNLYNAMILNQQQTNNGTVKSSVNSAIASQAHFNYNQNVAVTKVDQNMVFNNPSNNVVMNSNSNNLNFPTTNNLIVYNQHPNDVDYQQNVVDHQFNINTINNEIIKVTAPTIDLHSGSKVDSKSTVDTQLVNHSATNNKSTKLPLTKLLCIKIMT